MPKNAVRLPSLEELDTYALEQWEVCCIGANSVIACHFPRSHRYKGSVLFDDCTRRLC